MVAINTLKREGKYLGVDVGNDSTAVTRKFFSNSSSSNRTAEPAEVSIQKSRLHGSERKLILDYLLSKKDTVAKNDQFLLRALESYYFYNTNNRPTFTEDDLKQLRNFAEKYLLTDYKNGSYEAIKIFELLNDKLPAQINKQAPSFLSAKKEAAEQTQRDFDKAYEGLTAVLPN